jgi:hypothetical protein
MSDFLLSDCYTKLNSQRTISGAFRLKNAVALSVYSLWNSANPLCSSVEQPSAPVIPQSSTEKFEFRRDSYQRLTKSPYPHCRPAITIRKQKI